MKAALHSSIDAWTAAFICCDCSNPARRKGSAAVTRRFRPLLCVFIAVLLLQTVVAPAHCFLRMTTSAGWEVLICS